MPVHDGRLMIALNVMQFTEFETGRGGSEGRCLEEEASDADEGGAKSMSFDCSIHGYGRATVGWACLILLSGVGSALHHRLPVPRRGISMALADHRIDAHVPVRAVADVPRGSTVRCVAPVSWWPLYV